MGHDLKYSKESFLSESFKLVLEYHIFMILAKGVTIKKQVSHLNKDLIYTQALQNNTFASIEGRKCNIKVNLKL